MHDKRGSGKGAGGRLSPAGAPLVMSKVDQKAIARAVFFD